ncbi:uncharacterized protein [Panulirus ornatus]|uniref:uncharacterized protein n=1 Tax=Panulirus ornatus TaxID=150431 RepID=UPI003A875D23
MNKCITLKDDLKMPFIGITCSKVNYFFLGLIEEAIEHGLRHFEVPIDKEVFPRMWDRIEYGYDYICRYKPSDVPNQDIMLGRRRDYKDKFFISTTMHISTRLGPMMHKSLPPFLTRLDLSSVDLLFLENPFTPDANIRRYYEVDPDNKKLGYEPVHELFERQPETGILKVEPIIQQNLWLMWKRMEKMVMCKNSRVRHIGLRHFSKAHIEGILKVAKVPPSVVQADINLYNMQTELRRMCRERGIPVVAVNPFGNKNEDITWMPSLTKELVVVRMASKLRVPAQVVLMRHLIQSDVPFIYDLEHNCYEQTLKKVWTFELSEKQMAELASLDKAGSNQYKNEYHFRCELDPLWPFRIPPRKKRERKHPYVPRQPRGATRKRGSKRNCTRRPRKPGGRRGNAEAFELPPEENCEAVFRLAREPLSYVVERLLTNKVSRVKPHLLRKTLSSANIRTFVNTCLRMTDRMGVTDGRDVAEMTDGRDVAEMTDGRDVAEMTDGRDVAEMTDGRDVAEMTDGRDVAEMTDERDETEMTDGVDETDAQEYVHFRNIGGDFDAMSKLSLCESFSRAAHKLFTSMSGRGEHRRPYILCPQELEAQESLLGLDQSRPYVGVFHLDLTE